VEYLPVVTVINSLVTFVLMGMLAGVMKRYSGTRLLSVFLVGCGLVIAGLRWVIPLNIDLIYPLIYILDIQFEALLILVFWDLGNDLFNTRQSKRLFPLITIGGVVGRIASNFSTPFLVRAVSVDNLLLVYLGLALASALIAVRMGMLFPTLLVSPGKGGRKSKKKQGPGFSLFRVYGRMMGLVRESTLMKIVVLLTLLANIVIPILNYQFNVAVNDTFASEGRLIVFFSFFRGSMNIVSLILLLFAGRAYSRWGLPLALMVHPLNYVLVFGALFVRFDVISAMYARLSTNIIRTVLNAPVMGVLMGLFPEEHRAMVRPFLRGTVVRVGLLAGSGIILLSQNFVHPRYLSLAALVFVAGWIGAAMVLKREYAAILLDLISRGRLDLKALGENDARQVFRDRTAQDQLAERLLRSRDSGVLWYAEQLRAQGYRRLDDLIFQVLDHHDPGVKVQLMAFLSPLAVDRAVEEVRKLVPHGEASFIAELVSRVNTFTGDAVNRFNREILSGQDDPEVRGLAVRGLHKAEPERYGPVIRKWVASDRGQERVAGVIAAGGTADRSYIPILAAMLEKDSGEALQVHALESLGRLEARGLSDRLSRFLFHPSARVREAALNLWEIDGPKALETVLLMLNDPSPEIAARVFDAVLKAPFQDSRVLIRALDLPRRRVREGVFRVLEALRITDFDRIRYALSELEIAYGHLAEARSLRLLPECPQRELLADHLSQKVQRILDTLLRVLGSQEPGGRLDLVRQGIRSPEARKRSNSIEVLETVLEPSLARMMVPLLENAPPEEVLKRGRRRFSLPDPGDTSRAVAGWFLKSGDWVAVVLVLGLLKRHPVQGVDRETLAGLARSENPHIRSLALDVALVTPEMNVPLEMP
jgi:ATP/ADP translocase/HEAT repeat protein